jgi:hypothetical protein
MCGQERGWVRETERERVDTNMTNNAASDRQRRSYILAFLSADEHCLTKLGARKLRRRIF